MVSLRSSWDANTTRAVWGEIGGKLGLTWTTSLGVQKGMRSVDEYGEVDMGDWLDMLAE